jgi:hypothetical protein
MHAFVAVISTVAVTALVATIPPASVDALVAIMPSASVTALVAMMPATGVAMGASSGRTGQGRSQKQRERNEYRKKRTSELFHSILLARSDPIIDRRIL